MKFGDWFLYVLGRSLSHLSVTAFVHVLRLVMESGADERSGNRGRV